MGFYKNKGYDLNISICFLLIIIYDPERNKRERITPKTKFSPIERDIHASLCGAK